MPHGIPDERRRAVGLDSVSQLGRAHSRDRLSIEVDLQIEPGSGWRTARLAPGHAHCQSFVAAAIVASDQAAGLAAAAAAPKIEYVARPVREAEIERMAAAIAATELEAAATTVFEIAVEAPVEVEGKFVAMLCLLHKSDPVLLKFAARAADCARPMIAVDPG